MGDVVEAESLPQMDQTGDRPVGKRTRSGKTILEPGCRIWGIGVIHGECTLYNTGIKGIAGLLDHKTTSYSTNVHNK